MAMELSKSKKNGFDEGSLDLYLKEIHAKQKGIVLLHDGPPFSKNPRTVDLVKRIVPLLKLVGFKFVRLDQVPLRSRQIPKPPPEAAPADADAGQPRAAVDPCRGRTMSQSLDFEPLAPRAPIASYAFRVDPRTSACGGARHRH